MKLNLIVYTISRLIWNQKEFSLLLNRPGSRLVHNKSKKKLWTQSDLTWFKDVPKAVTMHPVLILTSENDFSQIWFWKHNSMKCNYFLTNVKRYPAIQKQAHRIVCIKRWICIGWIEFHDQTFTSNCMSTPLNTRSTFDNYVFKPTLPWLFSIERNSCIKFLWVRNINDPMGPRSNLRILFYICQKIKIIAYAI